MATAGTVSLRSKGIPLETLRIEVVEGPDSGARHVSDSELISVGTAPGNDLILTDETVSKHHLELERHGDRIQVRDYGSTNGTAIGSVHIERATIKPGTELFLGRTKLLVDSGGDTATAELYEDDHIGSLYGRTPQMRRLMATVERVAQTDVAVLILGETGTGKEVIANTIHEKGSRAKKPFETVDCGALLPTLIASELFGHERGAFTGADRQYVGAFERADGGTLFLDEIGELPASLQPTLLGVLERRKFRRLGGQNTISVDVRVLGATNRDLRAEVNAGGFRQDLYYRIAHLLLRIPPLRERPGDIAVLADRFLRQAGFHGQLEDVISSATMKLLKSHRWPGNVRELRNFVETALALGEEPELDAETRPDANPAPAPSQADIVIAGDLHYDSAVEMLQKALVERALRKSGGVVGHAANLLGMERTRLSKLRRRLRIAKPKDRSFDE